MSAARVVHFGGDECRRVQLLVDLGYQVDDCDSVVKLISALTDRPHPLPDLILVSESRRDPSPAEVSAIREYSTAPVLLFQSTTCQCDTSQFDAVVPALTPPELWLENVAALVRRSRNLQADAQFLQKRSHLLRRESAEVRRQSMQEREKLRASRSRDRRLSSEGDPVA